jgi:aerobic carbon-monoxide dehydrogenase small subunit
VSDPREATVTFELIVNGRRCEVTCAPTELLAEVLRERLRLTGTHIGCASGDCGACTVEVDGRAIKSCLRLAVGCEDAEITTIEGFAEGPDSLDPIQQAFWDEDGFQCGFCLPGQLFAARELLDRDPDPSEADIRHALAGNLCRCTGYVKMVRAVQAAARARRARA